jgi:hypothetical protein
MKLAVIGVVLAALAADNECGGPGSLSSADIRPGDGGIYIPTTGDGGEIFWPTADVPDGRQVRALPTQRTLCTLFAGDESDQSLYPRGFGLWIEDVKNGSLLGAPEPNSEYTDETTARLNYTYRKPNTDDQVVTLSLAFERLVVVERAGADILADGTALKGNPWPAPYFLSGITAGGLAGVFYSGSPNSLECWDPFLRESQSYRWIPCAWCKQPYEDFVPCVADPATDCFY